MPPSRLTSKDVAIYVHLVGAENARQLGAAPFNGGEAVGELRVDGGLGAETVVVGDEVVAAGLEAGEEPGERREVVPGCKGAAVGVGDEGGGGCRGWGGRPEAEGEVGACWGGERVGGEAAGCEAKV